MDDDNKDRDQERDGDEDEVNVFENIRIKELQRECDRLQSQSARHLERVNELERDRDSLKTQCVAQLEQIKELERENDGFRKETEKLKKVARLLLGWKDVRGFVRKPPVVTLAVLFLLITAGSGAYLLGRRAGSTPPAGPTQLSIAGAAPVPMLRLCGSNTIGSELVPALAEAFLTQELHASNVQRLVGHAADESEVQGVLPGASSASVIEIKAHGTGTGFVGLANHQCDVAMASRRVTVDESATLAAHQLGNMASPENEHVLGLDGVAVIVNPHNTVPFLTKSQVNDIFLGRIHNWNQVGGLAGDIHTYCRPRGSSGTYDTFKQLALDGIDATCTQYIENSAELSDAVAKDRNGIGFIGMPYILDTRPLAISDGDGRPIVPTRFNVATEDYVLSRRLYLYAMSTGSASQNARIRQFVDFAVSPPGQLIVNAEGFVGQTVWTEPQAPINAPSVYQQATRGAERLSVNFRFVTGGFDLEQKALADVQRVAAFLASPQYSGRRVLLFGFADNQGGPAVNLPLSRKRAEAVAAELTHKGVHVSDIQGFSSLLSVGSNSTDAGKAKNRRVEIWLAPQ